ncbi:MAG: hypothetical protein IH948_01695 [Bacteroidetes bacterium]|nr:hypothetical protein [Bacteroidota bacterium]
MIIDFFKSDHPRATFLLPLVIVGFWIFPFLSLRPVSDSVDMPLYELIHNLLGNSYVSIVFAMLLLFVEALLLNKVVMSKKVFSKKSYLPALLYIVLMSSFPAMLYLNPVIIANLFLILSLRKLFNIDKESDFLSDIFDASLFIGIASIIYLPSIVFILFVLYCLFILRRGDMKEKLIAIVGLIVPFAYVFTYYFWFDGVEKLWNELVVSPIYYKQTFHIYEYQFYVPIVVLVLLTILSFRKLYHEIFIFYFLYIFSFAYISNYNCRRTNCFNSIWCF